MRWGSQEFAALLAEHCATATGRLQLLEGALDGWALPSDYGDQHVAVLFSAAVARILNWPE